MLDPEQPHSTDQSSAQLQDQPRDRVEDMAVRDTNALDPGEFLSNLYGVLFTPVATFTRLRSQPSVAAGAIVVILVNVLEGARLDKSIGEILISLIPSLLGWLIFAVLLRSLALIFQHPVALESILTLTAFGSMPWIFIAPALSLTPPFSSLAAVVVMAWFLIWQVWAAAVALHISGQRLFLLVPLTILGGFVALVWSIDVIGSLASIF